MSKIIYRPISSWPGTLSKTRVRSQFRVELPQTLRELQYELDRLDVKEAVIELALTEIDLRNDGTPRVKAEYAHPGVVVSFDSKHGPLRYATDTFDDWRDNLRGIAKSLERLRDMDRYGVTGRGEQYAGWKALPAAGETGSHARAWLQALVMKESGDRLSSIETLTDKALVRAAQRYAHPDTGGSTATFAKVQRMAEAMGV